MSLKLICNASRYSFKKQIKPFTIESAINHKKLLLSGKTPKSIKILPEAP